MQKGAVFLFLLLTLSSRAEPVIPPSAQKYLEVLRKHPQSGTVFERFYSSWLEEGTAAGLLEHLSAQAVRPGATAADHLILALFHGHRGDDREALSAYDAALRLDAKNASAWLERARIEARLLDYPAALVSLEQAAAAKPGESLALDMARLKGRVLLRLDRNDEALALWRRTTASHASNEDLIEEIIDWYADEAQYEAAIETAEALVKRTRDPLARTLRQLRLADVLLLAERRDESLALLDTAFAATGAETWIEADVLGRIERVFRMTDDVAGLEKHLAGLVLANPQRVTLAWQHTLLLAGTGRSEEALKQARGLLQSNPGRRDLQEQFLDLLDSLSQSQEALLQARALSRQNPRDKELLIRIATLQQRTHDMAAAAATLEAYLAAEADEPALLRVARLLESWEKAPAKGETSATKAYRRLAAAFPQSMSAQEACAHYLHRSNRRDEALAIWKRLAQTAALDDLLRIAQALQARLESRPALDVLTAREADFSQQPRFLGLLVQTALANDEFQRAVPWALARLRLMHDADGIEEAMAPLRVLLRPEHSNLSASLTEELQKKVSLSIQERCLMAMLIHGTGASAAATQLLTNAAGADEMIALIQLTRLHEADKDWSAAAQTLQRVIGLPGARTPARLQRLVDLLRRANQPAEALKQISAWKLLTPSAIEPWLVEARVLGELYREADSLKVLQQAVRKFPDAEETSHAYATACLNAGNAAEAERIYFALYEKTTDTEARLRLIPPLVLAAQQHNALPHLVENFQRRQQQNRASAFPWLALAEIHRAARDDEARLRCLYEASRLRPQDLGLLLEIAHHEEKDGLYPEAIRTLETAAKLDKTTKVRERLAKIQIENGDADAGYRILLELSGGGQMAPENIEQIADAMALRGDWKNIPLLLQPALERHPRHYRLHYLYGVAQEESGHEKEALKTFLNVMDMHEEIPGVTPAPGLGSSMSLPAGAEDWLQFISSAEQAYGYQAKVRNLQYTWQRSLATTSALITLPSDVVRSPAFALAHVLRIASTLRDDEQQRMVTQLRRLGVAEAGVLLEAALSSSGFAITPELLSAHPANAALHAAWLLGPHETHVPPALEQCFELFKDRHPELAIFAVDVVLQKGPAEDAEPWFKRLIELCSVLPRSNHREWEPLLRLLISQSPEMRQRFDDPVIFLSPEETEKITAILHRWLRTETQLDSVRQITTVLLANARWDAAFTGFQRMIELSPASPPPPPPGLPCQPTRPWMVAPLPLSAAGTDLPPFIIEVLQPMLDSLYSEDRGDQETNMLWSFYWKGSPEESKQQVEQFQTAMRQRITAGQDPRLQLLLRFLCGDAKLLLAEWEPRARKPEATLQDILSAGWLLQFLNEPDKALGMFHAASTLTQDKQLRKQLDSACLFLAMHMQREGDSATVSEAVRRVFEPILKQPLTTEEKQEAVAFLTQFDLREEVDKILHSMPDAHLVVPKRSTPANQNPYSSLLSTGKRGVSQDLLDRLLLQDNDSGALAEALRRVRQLATRWVSEKQPANESEEMTTLMLKLGMHELREPFLAQLKTDARNDWERRLDYAAMLEMQHAHGRVFPNNDGQRSLSLDELRLRAIQEYEAVVTANPQAHGARRRLVMLLSLEDAAHALKHWTALPEAMQPTLLLPLTDRAGLQQDPAHVTAITRLITAWLKTLDPARPLSYQTRDEFSFVLEKIEQSESWPGLQEIFGLGWYSNESLRRQRNDRRIAHDALCRVMTRFPDLAEVAYVRLSGLAIFEQRDLTGMEELALQILSLRASRSAGRRPPPPRLPPAADGRLFEDAHLIANQPPAFFATWNAARRRDVGTLENVIYPAILKADGQLMLDFCRGYAEMTLAEDADFTPKAMAWVKRWVLATTTYAEAFQSGGMVQEVVRQWEMRKTAAPLDDLFLLYKELPISPRDAMDNSPLILGPTPYVQALLKREPAELRRFLLRIREAWISPDPEVRRRAMTRFLENQTQSRLHRNTPAERAAGECFEWLDYLMKTDGSQVAFEAAADDGALNAREWLENFNSQRDEVRTPGEFMILLRLLGYLQGAGGRHLLTVEGNPSVEAVWLARRFRAADRSNDLAEVMSLLGRHRPEDLDTHLLQAMFVHEGIKSIWLHGKPVMLIAPSDGGPMTLRDVAYRQVILAHAAEIAAMPVKDRSDLRAFLEMEESGLLQPPPGDTELLRAIEPVIQATAPGRAGTSHEPASLK